MKRYIALLLAVLTLLACVGCGAQPEPEELKPEPKPVTVGKKEKGQIHEVQLRDQKLIYDMYDPLEIETMYLTVSRGNSAENTDHSWEEINTYSVYDYEAMGVERYQVEGLLQVGDENAPQPGELGYGQISPNCTVQVRGQTSSREPQKNYKISIKENKGEWRGQKTIALNKHVVEGLRFRNKLAFDLMSDIDELMGLRTTFVHLYVKDQTAGETRFRDYGLYTQVEQLNKTALKAHGLDRKGHLYKVNNFEFYRYEDIIKLKTDPTYQEHLFEAMLETKGNDDHQKLIDFLTALNDFSISSDAIMERYLDVENLAYWMAFHILLGNVDTQNRNFYLYSPLNSEKWYILSWDCDSILKNTEFETLGMTVKGAWMEGVSNYWGNVLFQRCLKSAQFRKALDNAINDLRAELSEEKVGGMIDAYSVLTEPYVYSMPDRMYAPLTQTEYQHVKNSVYSEIEDNYRAYLESYKKPMPFYIGVPVIEGDKISLVWDHSYDFDAETIRYSVELSRDCDFRTVIQKEEGLMLPHTEFDMLQDGQYFVRVIAQNESGYSQMAFDTYLVDNDRYFGTKCFYVRDGKIVENVYVEG